MASYNRIIMIGNLTRDPEYKQLTSGQAVCRLGIASNRQFKNKQTGSMVQEVCFIDIDVWGPQAESCNQYLAKGRSILVEGRLKLDSWQDPDGNKRSKHSIVADRITFLASAQQDDLEESMSGDIDSGFMNAEPAKKSATQPARKATAKSAFASDSSKSFASTGEVTLKDEAPFEDDLPF